jgi:transposase
MHRSFYDHTRRQVGDLSSGPFRILLDIEVRRIQCRQCCAVKREHLSFLADNPFCTQRFAYYVGKHLSFGDDQGHCRGAAPGRGHSQRARQAIHACAAQARRHSGPKAIGIDEIAIRKGHTYRIVVSDLIRHRPIPLCQCDVRHLEPSIYRAYR